jgi:GNAT superfamily N-acetyltransferase
VDEVIEMVDPRRPDVRDALAEYLAEIVARGAVSHVDPDEADDVDDYTAPGGCFLAVSRGGDVIGCGAIRSVSAEVGEVKRMWIRPDARGEGLASLLLDALIEQSRAIGHTRLLLDTNAVLTQALALYRKHGFEPIERYNDNPDATHFLAREI